MENNSNSKQTKKVEIDLKEYKGVMLFSLILFNILLLVAVVSLLLSWNRWFIWLICIAIEGYCIGSSFYTYFKSIKRLAYLLNENGFEIISTSLDTLVPYTEISTIVVKTSLWDRLFKRKEQTIIINTTNSTQKKFVVYFIKEDANELAKQLLELSKTSKQKN